ncbi:MAG TPA: hypothetical protein VFI31_28030 [Pirellulales bacterium]|nr:hypothetical protein [Pirellulales bacterium]
MTDNSDNRAPQVLPGDIWSLLLGGVHRHAKVVSAARTAGWWNCIDEETGIAFTASARWFVDRLPDDGDTRPPEIR